MLTLKRLYLYTVLGISLVALLMGLSDVVRFVLDRVSDTFASRTYISDDLLGELSWAIALVIVAMPVFLVHLVLVRRSLQGPAAAVADERACASRSTYFFLVLTGTGIVAATQLADLLQISIGTVAFGERSWGLAAAVAGSLVVGGAWLAHVWVRRSDLRAAPARTAGDWLTRAYLYGALFVAAILACVGAGNLLTVAARMLLDLQPAWEASSWWQEELAWAVTALLVAGAAWLVHWAFAARLLRAAPPMGEAHRAAHSRPAYFLLFTLSAAVASLVFVSMGLSNVFAELAGTWRPTDGSRFIEEVGGPLLMAVPFVAAWWWHLRRASAEALAFGGPGQALAVRRIGRLVVATVGLAGLAIGVAWELQALLDAIASGGSETLYSSDEADALSTSALAAALVGLVLWAPAWVMSQRERARDIETVAMAASRRAYLFVVVGASVVAFMIALAFVIYQATRYIVGTELVDDASWAPAVMIVSAVVLAYHLWCLRADMLVARAVEASATPAVDEERVSQIIEISAPAGADFKVLNAAIRTELPDGFELRVVPPESSEA